MDIDEDVNFLVGNALRASDTTSSGLAIGIHGHRISWREIWKSGNLGRPKNLETVDRPQFQIFRKKSKSWP
jgi:hypothetical protein